jgi:hypothetical protein
MSIETLGDERLAELVINDRELDALIRVLYVVMDNFWLDATEESVLERLLDATATPPIRRGDTHARRHSHVRSLEHRGIVGARPR